MDYDDSYVSDYYGEALGGKIKRGGHPTGKLKRWVDRVREYSEEKGITYKDALIALGRGKSPKKKSKTSPAACKSKGSFRYAGTGRCRTPCKRTSEFVNKDNLCKPAISAFQKAKAAKQLRLSGYGYYSDSEMEGGALRKCKTGYSRSVKTKRCRKKCQSGYARSRTTGRCRKIDSKRKSSKRKSSKRKSSKRKSSKSKSSKRKSSKSKSSKRKSSKSKSSKKCKTGSYKSVNTGRCRKVCKTGSYRGNKGGCRKAKTKAQKTAARRQRRLSGSGALGGCGCCNGSGLMEDYNGGLFDCPQCMGNALGGAAKKGLLADLLKGIDLRIKSM